MRFAIAVCVSCAVAGIATGAGTPAQKPAPKAATPGRKTASAAASKVASPAPASKVAGPSSKRAGPSTATNGSRPAARTTSAKRSYGRPPVRRYRTHQQLAPAPDRYREIQQALAERGYLKTTPNGVWDKDSIDAMQRFQQDQNLDATGKLTARSLTALGLGAKTPVSTGPPGGTQGSFSGTASAQSTPPSQ
jgi:Putative peptidoglycan binding domain